MGSAESVFQDVPIEKESQPQRTRRRLRPNAPIQNVLKHHGIVIGLPASGKRTLLKRLEGKDPFTSSEEPRTQVTVPFHSDSTLWDRVQLHMEIPGPSMTLDAVNFAILLVHPQHDPKVVRSYFVKLLSPLLQQQTGPLAICFMLNFRDQQSEHQLIHEHELEEIAQQILSHYENRQNVVVQVATMSLRNCYGLNTLHHFIYRSYLLRKQAEWTDNLRQCQQLIQENRTIPSIDYNDFLKLLQQTPVEDASASDNSSKHVKWGKNVEPRRIRPHVLLAPVNSSSLEAFLAESDEEGENDKLSPMKSMDKDSNDNSDDDGFFYDVGGHRKSNAAPERNTIEPNGSSPTLVKQVKDKNEGAVLPHMVVSHRKEPEQHLQKVDSNSPDGTPTESRLHLTSASIKSSSASKVNQSVDTKPATSLDPDAVDDRCGSSEKEDKHFDDEPVDGQETVPMRSPSVKEQDDSPTLVKSIPIVSPDQVPLQRPPAVVFDKGSGAINDVGICENEIATPAKDDSDPMQSDGDDLQPDINTSGLPDHHSKLSLPTDNDPASPPFVVIPSMANLPGDEENEPVKGSGHFDVGFIPKTNSAPPKMPHSNLQLELDDDDDDDYMLNSTKVAPLPTATKLPYTPRPDQGDGSDDDDFIIGTPQEHPKVSSLQPSPESKPCSLSSAALIAIAAAEGQAKIMLHDNHNVEHEKKAKKKKSKEEKAAKKEKKKKRESKVAASWQANNSDSDW